MTGAPLHAQSHTYANGDDNTGTLDSTGDITLGITTGTATQSGVIFGSGGVTINALPTNLGTLLFTGANTYTGSTLVRFGTLGISGAGASTGTTSGDLKVSSLAGENAALTISAGGRFTDASGDLASDAGGTGAATITGAGSTWANGFDLVVGRGGDGTLTISSGGTATDRSGYIGHLSGSTGVATVTGANSLWSHTGSMNVGGAGSGTLTISNGGRVAGTAGAIGYESGGTGDATVTGADSLWSNTGAMNVGGAGNGTLTISNGGRVAGATGAIGYASGGTGAATVTGVNSTWSNTGDLQVGSVSNGTLTISGGGLVTSATAYVGYGSGSTGAVTVTGTGSRWSQSGDTSVGVIGSGTLTVSDGGVVTGKNGFIGYNPTGAGAVTVTGAGSRWSPSSSLVVGVYGAGTLTIADGGTVLASTVILANDSGAQGTVNLNAGGTLVTGAIAKKSGSGATMLNLNGGTLRARYGIADFVSNLSGRFSVLAGGGTIDNNGYAITIKSALAGPGALTLTGGGTTTLMGGNTYSGGTIVSAGKLIGTTGSLQGSIANDAQVVFDQSGSGTFAGVISGSGTVTKTGAGTMMLSAPQTYTGTTILDRGTLQVNNSLASAAVLVQAQSTLAGSGPIPGTVSVENGGSLSSGSGPGTLALGSLELNNTSGLLFDLGTPGVAGGGVNDLVAVGGDLTLDGYLNITAQAGYGEGSYTLFTYTGSLVDHGLLFGVTPGGYYYAVDYGTSGQVRLTVSTTGLQYWNGSVTTADGIVHGGSGTWAAGTTNWTNSTGTTSSAWGGGTAVFTGIGRTVTVSGTQAIQGIEFVSDGYVLTGGALDIGPGAELKADDFDTIASTITGTGGVTIAGAGTIALTGSNTYPGGTTLESGTLQIASDAALGAAAGGLTIQHGVLFTTATMSTGRDIVFDNADGTIQVADGTTLTLGGSLSGYGGLLKTGDGTLRLAGVGNINHNATVQGGTLEITGSFSSIVGAIGDADGLDGRVVVDGDDAAWNVGNLATVGNTGYGSLEILNGGRMQDYYGYIGAVAGSHGDALVSDAGSEWNHAAFFVVGDEGEGELTIDDGGAVSDFSGVLGNSSGGSGSATMNDGTWSNMDRLTIGYGGDGRVTQNDGGISAAEVIIADLPSSTGTLDLNGGALTTGKVKAGDGVATVNFDGGTIVATGDEPDFLSNFQEGHVVLRSGGGTIDTGDHAIAIATPLTGTGGLKVKGGGTLTLTGNNTYTGATSISSGTLVVDGSIASSSMTTVGTGSMLSGSGTVGAVTLAPHAAISPGSADGSPFGSPGTLSTGNETWAGGGTYVWELDNASDAPGAKGATYDWLNIAGTLDLTAVTSGTPFTINIVSLTASDFAGLTPGFVFEQTYQWTIATANGGISGFSADKFAFDTSEFQSPFGTLSPFTISQVGNSLVLNYTVVPEPSACALCIAALLVVLIIFRRRRIR